MFWREAPASQLTPTFSPAPGTPVPGPGWHSARSQHPAHFKSLRLAPSVDLVWAPPQAAKRPLRQRRGPNHAPLATMLSRLRSLLIPAPAGCSAGAHLWRYFAPLRAYWPRDNRQEERRAESVQVGSEPDRASQNASMGIGRLGLAQAEVWWPASPERSRSQANTTGEGLEAGLRPEHTLIPIGGSS